MQFSGLIFDILTVEDNDLEIWHDDSGRAWQGHRKTYGVWKVTQ
jgi:hypothetical protein